ncbi:1-phosphatidylinositol-4-phosphate 5-kinase [Dioszegia hungarica]|uniref:1-phosphatidylinositol-4-phosphate 5-kinase n=1 Tax=Dioszegia hungarica TaxID=4972 RepID=A0AA38H012_9TREE|nr:1-phosphatidylinositol-4-phosphate 5-kinase [Dioszegia hungarica]KAI9632132.1 1-phosphatidylinositol-4-phosphate 5-kinase [Dioszegia hungarica]
MRYGKSPAISKLMVEPASPKVNPFHYLSHPSGDAGDLPELPTHLQALVTDTDHPGFIDTVRASQHDPPMRITKVSADTVRMTVLPHRAMQGPPPSPPISEGEDIIVVGAALTAEPEAVPEAIPEVIPEPPIRRLSNGSTRTGSLAVVRSGRLAPAREPAPPLPPKESPVPAPVPKLSRKPTNPAPRAQTPVPGLEGQALDSDIIAQAEAIRKERLERRQKKASVEKEPQVVVGNLIGEDHVNFVLMYNMLTGIRIAVSRTQAKIRRPLTDEDYLARHKYSFDIVGNELTPSARYDFKFKDYAPWIFRDLREEHFHLDPADYLLSLTAKYILSELGSPGKSGSFFYFSRDYRFIIKTIAHSEHKFLRSILKDYHQHIINNPHSLLSRFYGLHRVKLPRGRKIHFLIMNNLFPPHRDIHETYDLKGSAFGREYPEEKAQKNPRAVLKDINWVNRGRTLAFGPEKRALLTEQLRRDMEFLRKIGVMDYSLLVGIHNMERGNKDNLRENQLSVFHPEMYTSTKDMRKAVKRSDPQNFDVTKLPLEVDRNHFLFYQDEGGMQATDEANQAMDAIYYLGVIDICTPYNTAKKLEHFWKSMTEGATISCVDPDTYGHRFINFLQSVMRGGDMSLRPAGLMPDITSEKPIGHAS